MSAKKDLSETERNRKELLEKQIEQLRRQLEKKEQEENQQKQQSPVTEPSIAEPGKGENVDEWI